ALDAAAVGSIVLKGPTIARWLYTSEEPRGYRDCDLLVPSEAVETAETVLAGLGFERRYDVSGLPDWWVEHAHEWWRESDAVWVDLHDGLSGLGVDKETVWSLLS